MVAYSKVQAAGSGRALLRRRVVPGFGLTLGLTLMYLTFLLGLPLAALVIKASGISLDKLLTVIGSEEAMASYRVTIVSTLAAAAFNAVMGTVLAWILVRYPLPLKRLWDAIVDLPFALPGAVGGIALAAVFADTGPIGSIFEPLGIQLAYSGISIVIAMVFTGLPFVVRSVQPVLENLETEQEEAAYVLGANRLIVFWRVVFPAIFPAILTGFTMAVARGLGEFGTVIFITSNIPLSTEVTSKYLYNLLEAYDIEGATAVGAVTMAAAFLLLLVLNLVQNWQRRREQRA